MKFFAKKNKQNNNIVHIKYSKLDNIGKVKKVEVPDKQEIDNNINNTKNELTNQITEVNDQLNNRLNNQGAAFQNHITRIDGDISNTTDKITKISNDLKNANLASFKGNYSTSTAYKLGELVAEPNTTNVYLSLQNNNLNKPLTDTNYWKIITFSVDTSDYVTNTQLNDRLSDYWTSVQTVQQINLKTRSSTYFQELNKYIDFNKFLTTRFDLGQVYLWQLKELEITFQFDNAQNKYKSGKWIADLEMYLQYGNLRVLFNIKSNPFEVAAANKVVITQKLLSENSNERILQSTGTGVPSTPPTLFWKTITAVHKGE